MKTWASIFSWLGGIGNIIVNCLTASGVIRLYDSYLRPEWRWIATIVSAILIIVILIWRHFSIRNGKKIAVGVCTLLFCSLIGGILTLCIPEDDLY